MIHICSMIRNRFKIHLIGFAAAGVAVGAAVGIADDRAAKLPVLLRKYCADCHMGGSHEGDVSLDGVRGFADAKPDVWERMHEQIQLGHMPPKDTDQPTADERALLVGVIADSLTAAGHHVNNRLEWPNYGNYVPHEPLFHEPPHPAPATPIRLWRQRPQQYAARNGGGTQAFSLLPGQQILDFAALYTVDESAAEIVLRNAQQLVERWTKVEMKDGAAVRAADSQMPKDAPFLGMLQPGKPPTPEQFAASVNWVFAWALNRQATPEELADIRQLYDSVATSEGPLLAARAALTAPLLKPEAVYRVELGAGPLDKHGRRRLSKREVLSALRHTLTDRAEDGSNLAVTKSLTLAAFERTANRGDSQPLISRLNAAGNAVAVTLETSKEVAALVRELLDTPLPSGQPNPRVLNFFDEYFDFLKAQDVFKDIPPATSFAIMGAIDDTRQLIARIVAADKDVFRTLLTTDQTYAHHRTDRHHHSPHRLYGLPADWKKTLEPVTLRADERAGILTQPAWLVAYSGNFDNDLVRRGKWVLEHLLGGTVPDVPVTVCANVPADETKTLRRRFDVITNDSYCWQCHRQMNQLGMPFEAYDHFGRFRLQELKKPVDSSGAIVDSGVPGLDGPVGNAVEMIHKIANTDRAREVFVRYAFRYFLGRNETVRDAKTLQEADRAYRESGGSMKALVVSLLSSDSFLYRSGVGEGKPIDGPSDGT